MPVLLRSSSDLNAPGATRWATLTSDAISVAPETRVRDFAQSLEEAFAKIGDTWWDIARQFGTRPDGSLCYTLACSPNASDFGLMLAQTEMVTAWAGDTPITLVVCDDPWLFRHLARISGVQTGSSPPLFLRSLVLRGRGFLSRTRCAVRMFRAALRLRLQPRKTTQGGASLVSFGHPRSTPEGHDGYFADLMRENPHLRRVLHVDCGPQRALELAAGGQTVSLQAWGSPLFALTLPFRRWRPEVAKDSPYFWLLCRAAALEGGGGTAAMLAWQEHCQARWLACCRPAVVTWPWENHPWERALVREAKRLGTRTVGYQHSVVGQMMYHYSRRSLPDGDAALPDLILCTSESTRQQLLAFGIPEGRLKIGGALRFAEPPRTTYDPAAPVFMAVPFDAGVAHEMIEAAKAVKDRSLKFLVKDHPMFPVSFEESETVRRTREPLTAQKAVSGVVYAATTVGLEALVAGVPTLRFRSERVVAVDIMPASLKVPVAGRDDFETAIRNFAKPVPIDREYCFGTPDDALWRQALSLGEVCNKNGSVEG